MASVRPNVRGGDQSGLGSLAVIGHRTSLLKPLLPPRRFQLFVSYLELNLSNATAECGSYQPRTCPNFARAHSAGSTDIAEKIGNKT